jgi:hypothetical protein
MSTDDKGANSILSEQDWQRLLTRIQSCKVTPIIGAGACAGILPDGRTLSRLLANDYSYPLDDAEDLQRVAQYGALTQDPIDPKERVAKLLRNKGASAGFDSFAPDNPHGLLADLRLPLYITTNYDHFMSDALQARKVETELAVPCWDNSEPTQRESDNPASATPTKPKTLVYHLHGHWDDVQNMTLTEDDYLEFMRKLMTSSSQMKDRDSSMRAFLPPRILNALTGTSLLFVGYSMADWNFRILLRGLVAAIPSGNQYGSVAVQLPPGKLSGVQQQQAQDYLKDYLGKIAGGLKFKIFWGDVKVFTNELRRRLTPASQAVHA